MSDITGSDTGTEVEHVDLLIIGAGSGNGIPTPAMADLRIAIVDDAPWFGGTCLNVGCIPTKMFVHVGELLRDARDGERLGLRDVEGRVDWPAVRDRVFGRIDAISEAGETYRRSGEPNTSLVRESVRFIGPRTVRTASGRVIEADRVVIGAGSRPRALDALPFDDRVVTSNEIMRIDALPERLVVVGGGVVANEFASIFHAFGVEVVQLVRNRLLGAFDDEIQARFTAAASAAWEVRTGVQVVSSSRAGDEVHLVLDDGSTVVADLVLVAAGPTAR